MTRLEAATALVAAVAAAAAVAVGWVREASSCPPGPVIDPEPACAVWVEGDPRPLPVDCLRLPG